MLDNISVWVYTWGMEIKKERGGWEEIAKKYEHRDTGMMSLYYAIELAKYAFSEGEKMGYADGTSNPNYDDGYEKGKEDWKRIGESREKELMNKVKKTIEEIQTELHNGRMETAYIIVNKLLNKK